MRYTILFTLDHDYLIIGFDGSDYRASIIRTGWNPHTLSAINFNFCEPVDRKLVPKIFKDHYWTKKKFQIHFPLGFEANRNVYLFRRDIPVFDLFDGTHKDFIKKLEMVGFNFTCFQKEIAMSEFDPDHDYLFYGKSIQRKCNLLLNYYKEQKINYCVVSDFETVSFIPSSFHLVVYLDEFSKEFLTWLLEMKHNDVYVSIVFMNEDYSIVDKNLQLLESYFTMVKC